MVEKILELQAYPGIPQEELEKSKACIGISALEYSNVITTLQAFGAQHHQRRRLLVICDPLVEIDDYANNFMQSTGVLLGLVEMVGVITNGLWPTERRDFQTAVYDELGVHVPVAIGTEGTDEQRPRETYELRNRTFAAHGKALRDENSDVAGQTMLRAAFEEAVSTGRSLTLMLQSSLRDITKFLDHIIEVKGGEEAAAAFVRAALDRIVFQGGACQQYGAKIVPDRLAANNKWDVEAAAKFWNFVHVHKIPYDAVSSHVAARAALDFDMLNSLPGPVGYDFGQVLKRLVHCFTFDPYYSWNYMPHHDLRWYLTTRCGMDSSTRRFKETLEAAKERRLSLRELMALSKVPVYDAFAGLLGVIPDELLESLGVLDKNDANYKELGYGYRWFGQDREHLGGLDADTTRRVVSIMIHYGACSGTKEGEMIFSVNKLDYDWDKDTPETIENTRKLIENGPSEEVLELARRYLDLAALMQDPQNATLENERLLSQLLHAYWKEKQKTPIGYETTFAEISGL